MLDEFRVGSGLLAAAATIGLLYYVWVAIRRRSFDRYISGQVLMLIGFIVLAAGPLLYPDAPAVAHEVFLWCGGFLVLYGMVLAAIGRRASKRPS